MVAGPAATDWSLPRRLVMALLVAAACSSLYSAIGLRFAATPAFSRNNYLFHSDPRRVITELADRSGNHYRTKVHPIFVLLFNPVGSRLRTPLGSPDTAAIVLNALAGGVAAGLAFLFFLSRRLTPLHAVGLTALVAFSAAHLLYGSIPEIYIFSAGSLVLLVLLTVSREERQWPLVAAGVLATGILTTNIVQASLLFHFGDSRRTSLRHGLRRTAVYVALVLAITGALSGLQKVLYPSSRFFFEPSAYAEESKYIPSYEGASEVLERAGEFLKALVLFDIVAPAPIFNPGPPPPSDWRSGTAGEERSSKPVPRATFVGEPTTVHGVGVVAALLWAALMLIGCWGLVRERGRGTDAMLKKGLLACLLFNFGLYMVYGQEPFQYSCNWTFLSLALVALGLRPVLESKTRLRALGSVLVLLLAPVLLAANLVFVSSLLKALR